MIVAIGYTADTGPHQRLAISAGIAELDVSRQWAHGSSSFSLDVFTSEGLPYRSDAAHTCLTMHHDENKIKFGIRGCRYDLQEKSGAPCTSCTRLPKAISLHKLLTRPFPAKSTLIFSVPKASLVGPGPSTEPALDGSRQDATTINFDELHSLAALRLDVKAQ